MNQFGMTGLVNHLHLCCCHNQHQVLKTERALIAATGLQVEGRDVKIAKKNMNKNNPMTPPTISPEARKELRNNAQTLVHNIMFMLGVETIHEEKFRECCRKIEVLAELSVSTSTKALAKENAELREMTQKQTQEACPKCNYMRSFNSLCRCGLFASTNQSLRNQIDASKSANHQLQARVKELEAHTERIRVAASQERDTLTAQLATMADSLEVIKNYCEGDIERSSMDIQFIHRLAKQALTPPTPNETNRLQ